MKMNNITQQIIRGAETQGDIFQDARCVWKRSQSWFSDILHFADTQSAQRSPWAGFANAHAAPSRKFAFTLAEVLITFGIIGIVASMTLPALVQDYQKKQFAVMAKTNYVILNNALERAKSEYGTDVNNWIYSSSTRNEQAVDFLLRFMYMLQMA